MGVGGSGLPHRVEGNDCGHLGENGLSHTGARMQGGHVQSILLGKAEATQSKIEGIEQQKRGYVSIQLLLSKGETVTRG